MSSNPNQRANNVAGILADQERTWRYWRDFIREQKDAFARQKDERAGFDAFGMPLEGTSLHPFQANLPADVRAEYVRILEMRRQETQRKAEEQARTNGLPAPDRDLIYEQLLTRFEDELTGKVAKNGHAIMYDNGQKIIFNHHRVASRLSDADYQAFGAGKANQDRLKVIVGIVGVCIVFVIAIVLFEGMLATPPSTQTAEAVASVNGTPLTLWDTTEIAVAGRQFAVPFARAGYPLQVCIPAKTERAFVPEASVILTGTQSVRSYELVELEAARADLILSDCAQSPPKLIAKGLLQEAHTSTQLDPNLLRSISVRGADSDPIRIPQDRMLVTLVLDPQLSERGTLILEDGSRFAPTKSETADHITLTYLVPLSPFPQAVGLEFLEMDHLPAILAFTLPAPTSHAQLLRDVLQIESEEPEIVEVNGGVGLRINLVIKNAGDEAIAIRNSDPICRQGSTALVPQWQELMLEGQHNQRQTLTCVGIDAQRPLEVELANWAMKYTFLP
jgi:hypothetical protein